MCKQGNIELIQNINHGFVYTFYFWDIWKSTQPHWCIEDALNMTRISLPGEENSHVNLRASFIGFVFVTVVQCQIISVPWNHVLLLLAPCRLLYHPKEDNTIMITKLQEKLHYVYTAYRQIQAVSNSIQKIYNYKRTYFKTGPNCKDSADFP